MAKMDVQHLGCKCKCKCSCRHQHRLCGDYATDGDGDGIECKHVHSRFRLVRARWLNGLRLEQVRPACLPACLSYLPLLSFPSACFLQTACTVSAPFKSPRTLAVFSTSHLMPGHGVAKYQPKRIKTSLPLHYAHMQATQRWTPHLAPRDFCWPRPRLLLTSVHEARSHGKVSRQHRLAELLAVAVFLARPGPFDSLHPSPADSLCVRVPPSTTVVEASCGRLSHPPDSLRRYPPAASLLFARNSIFLRFKKYESA